VVEFRVLGPVEVYSDDKSVHVGGVKQRSILAFLIASHGQTVTADRIVGEVYGEDAAPGARRSVQTIVSMLRRDLGDVIIGTREGYRFDAPRTAVDAYQFEDGVAAGLKLLEADPRQASSVFDETLGLWRGDPYGDVDGRGAFQPEVARLTELRFTALEARVEADLACGRHREVLAELEALVAEYPLRERLWGWLMLALYRTGRQADALAAYQRARTVLGEQLGLDPSNELRELEEQILLHDQALDLVIPVPHNLPAQLTSFVGRRLELIELDELLTEKRLVTLTGAGGSGKTRLAIELARGVLDGYPDGAWFVDLRDVDADGVAPLIASTLGVVLSGGAPIADLLIDALVGRRLLLVLDNCEHVLGAAAPLVERLTSRDGHLRVLATSREPLGVPGESTMPVKPLPVPESDEHDQVAVSDAVVLFAERAGAVQPDFALEEHVDSVFEICRSVEGLPLALELAAARLIVFSPEELAVRLVDQLAELKTTQKAGDLRHATMAATVGWSWEILNDAERTLLERLSVFHGTWPLGAAEAICAFEPINRNQAADLMASLVAKSLVVVDGVSRGSTRYRLLEPIRQYAARELDDRATGQLRSRFVDYWSRTLAELHEPYSGFSMRDYDRARELEDDRANLAVAIEWALASGRFEDAMTIFISPFGDLLVLRGSAFGVASRWIDTAIEHRKEISPDALVEALSIMCSIASSDWRNEACVSYAERAIELSTMPEQRYRFGLFAAVGTTRQGRHEEANRILDQIIAKADDSAWRACALLAKSQYELPRAAWELCEAAMDLSPIDSLGWWDEGYAAWLIGEAAGGSGRYEVALKMEERAVELSRQSGWLVLECTAAATLAWLYAIGGRLDEASALLNDTVPLVRRMHRAHSTALSIHARAADVARLQGDLDQARGTTAEIARMTEPGSEMVRVGEGTRAFETALIARDGGDYARALELLDGLVASLEVSGQASDLGSMPGMRIARAGVHLRTDDPDRALEDLGVVLAEPQRLFHHDALTAVDLTAIALAQQNRADKAARLFSAIDRERDNCGLVIPTPDQPLREQAVSATRSVLEHDWDSALAQGRTLALDEALVYAATEANVTAATPAATPHAASSTISPS
jgi:predicted ATPase/DNA-binding SARP family transcriptional activator